MATTVTRAEPLQTLKPKMKKVVLLLRLQFWSAFLPGFKTSDQQSLKLSVLKTVLLGFLQRLLMEHGIRLLSLEGYMRVDESRDV